MCAALQVVKAVAGAVPVLVDGGVRRGTDVLKALALGAKAVMVHTYAAPLLSPSKGLLGMHGQFRKRNRNVDDWFVRSF